MLYVHIGTANGAKTHAIRSVFEAYRVSLLNTLGINASGADGNIEYAEYSVPSGVADNPRNFDETIQGALNRATAALRSHPGSTEGQDVVLGVGIESGFINFPSIGTAYCNFDVCCIQLDNLTVYGFSQGTEYPSLPLKRMFSSGEAFDKVMQQHLDMEPPNAKVGFMGILSDFQYPRQRVSAIAVEHAVLRLIHKDDYYR